MVKKLLCISSELNGFTNGKLYNIVSNEASHFLDKWVYNDNGEYVYIANSLINTYFKLIEEKSEVKTMNVEEMDINELYQLQNKLKEQIDKEVIQSVVEVNDTIEILMDKLDVLFSMCQMFDIQVNNNIENLQNELLTIVYDSEEKYVFN